MYLGVLSTRPAACPACIRAFTLTSRRFLRTRARSSTRASVHWPWGHVTHAGTPTILTHNPEDGICARSIRVRRAQIAPVPSKKKTHKISITRFVESAVTGNLRTQYKIKISWARFGGASVYRTRRYIPLCLQVDSACLILQGSSISNQCIYVLNVDRAPANRRNVDTVYLSCCLAGYCWRAVPILQGKMNLLLNAPSRRQIASARQQGINGRIAAQTSFSSS